MPSAAHERSDSAPRDGSRVERRGAWLGVAGSLALHAAAVVAVWAAPSRDYGFTFDVPVDLELGMTDGTTVVLPATAAPAAPAPPENVAVPEPSVSDAVASTEGPRASRDAGVEDDVDAARRRRRDAGASDVAADMGDAGVDEGQGAADAGAPAPLVASSATSDSPVAFLPPGGQLALRLDLARVRESPYRRDIERLVGRIPDWQAVLGASPIQPVRDLDRLLLATPNLRRETTVIAGRLGDVAADPRATVEQMIVAAGGTPGWEEVDGVTTSEWPNPDETPRRVALLGPRHFVIARASDLPRVLAIAAARAEVPDGGAPTQDAADALLALGELELATLDVEGARRYVPRAPCTVPQRLHASIELAGVGTGGSDVGVHVRAHFDDAAQAREAAACFTALRDQAVRDYLFPALQQIEIHADGEDVGASTVLVVYEVRLLLSYLASRLGSRTSAPPPVEPPRPPPPPPPLPPAPPPPAQ